MNPPRLLAAALLIACAQPPDPAVETHTLPLGSAPYIPVLLPDVHLTEANNSLRALIPPFRTSADGRVGVDMKKRDPHLYLLVPERLSEPVTDPTAAPGVSIVAAEVVLDRDDFFDANVYDPADPRIEPEHRTICDATPQFSYGANTPLNPHPCDMANPKYSDHITDLSMDCYNLTMVTSVQYTGADGSNRVQLWGKPFTVAVQQPKRWDGVSDTGAQIIADVDVSAPPVEGPSFAANSILEPMVTQDGRLLVGRLGKSTRDPNTGLSRGGDKLDVVYATYAENFDPCDVTRFSTLHPLSHAYADPAMDRYGIAAYPLRDPHGEPIADGDDLQVSYPWVDREGNNVFFTTLDATLYNDDGTGVLTERFPARCVTGACVEPLSVAAARLFENSENFRGFGFAGLWSHGKMVLLDGALNNIDYGLGRSNAEQMWLDLYTPNTHPSPGGATHLLDASGELRIGTGRANGFPPPDDFTTENSSFLDSLQQLFNYNEYLHPLTMRDVVWTMNTGKVSAELIFDDYLDPNALVLAEMTGALEHRGFGTFPLRYYDGFDQTGEMVVEGAEEVRFQNSATAPGWVLPPFGVAHGDVRLEPVALGGIEGKGAWLDGTEDAISFNLPVQSEAYEERAWYVGLFVDPRFPDSGARQLLRFADGSEVVLVGLDQVVYRNPAGLPVANIALTGVELVEGAWSHLAWVVDVPNNRTRLLVNGLLFHTKTGFAPQVGPGDLYVGDDPGDALVGFTGWIDELKVLAYEPELEVKCNHARGTLMGLTEAATAPWLDIAQAHPNGAHNAITQQLQLHGQQSYSRYVCYHDYSAPIRSNPRFVTAPGLVSIRTPLLFPEGPLKFQVERPDSSANTFCLSCHHSAGQRGLGLAALDAGAPGVELQNDIRRQPLMPPRVMFGNVPAWFFPAGPSFDLHTGDHGLDRYVFPGP